MKRTVRAQTALILVVTILLAGCAKSAPQKADVSFPLPEGYAIANETGESCSIVREETGEAVGGFELTELRRKDLKDKNFKNILRYLQNEFHKTNNVEFMAMHGEDEKGPFVVVTMTRHSDDSDEQRHFNHTFFEHGSMVYHLWLDCDLLDEEETHEITSTVFPE